MERSCLMMKISDYLKNHWTKHRHVCTHFYAFSLPTPNKDMKCNISEFFENFMKK